MPSVTKTIVVHKYDEHLGEGIVCAKGSKQNNPGCLLVRWSDVVLVSWHIEDCLIVVKEERINV
jgi:hypothetical protein